MIRAAYLLGTPKRRRGRMPRQILPSRIEYEYARAIQDYVELVRVAHASLFAELPGLLESVRRERRDAGEGARVRQLLDATQRRIREAIRPRELESLATTIATRTARHQKQQLTRQIRSVLGVDVLTGDRALASIMDGFVAENVALIKNVPLEIAADLEKMITRAVSSGTLHKDLAKEIAARWDIGNRRAALIARDQTGKFYGQVNAARQREIGIEEFIWRTVNDRRVRGTPGGAFPNARYSHYARNGQRFRYDDPPADGLPGEPILCRCYPEPVV